MSLKREIHANQESSVTALGERRIDKAEQVEMLKEFSSSNFNDLCWKLDRMNRDKNPNLFKPVNFEEFSAFPRIVSELKEWTIILLSEGLSEGSINNLLRAFKKLLRQGLIQSDSLFEIEKSQLIEYYYNLELNRTDIPNKSRSFNWKSLKKFYREMGAKDIYSWMQKFYIPEIGFKLNEKRLIPQEVIEELDRIFYYEEMPVSFRLCYWLLRLIPNRMEEVISVPFDCVADEDDFSYVLKLPTFKQAGAYAEAQWRQIHLKKEGSGAYLLDLIRKQQQYLKDDLYQSNFLIADCKWSYLNGSLKKSGDNYLPFSSKRFNRFLKRIIGIYDVRDKNGLLAHVTSHMFRHNAVTERIDSGLFSFHDIKLMSGHHTTTMLEIAYNHPDFNKSKETVLSYGEEIPEFKGKVLPGATGEDFRRLASRPYAREIGGLGVCRDVRGCKARFYKCYECEHFTMESRDPAKLKEEKIDWESKKLLAQRTGDKNFEDECDNNINGINLLLERIKNER